MERGKADVFISYEDHTEENFSLRYHEEIAAEYLGYLRSMAERFGIENDVRVSTLSRYPEVFVMEEQGADEKELWPPLERAVRTFWKTGSLRRDGLPRRLYFLRIKSVWTRRPCGCAVI